MTMLGRVSKVDTQVTVTGRLTEPTDKKSKL